MWSFLCIPEPVSVIRPLLTGLVLCFLTSVSSAQSVSGDSDVEPVKFSFDIQQGRPGPWGDLEYFPMILEPADFYVSLNTDLKNWPAGTVWGFEATAAAEVFRILLDSGLDRDLATRLTGPDFLTKNETTGYLEIRPPEDVIIQLSSNQRRLLYPQLKPDNDLNCFARPFSLHPDGILVYPGEKSGVSSELVSLVEKMSYRGQLLKHQGPPNRFSDINLALKKARDDRERWNLIKTISRDVTLSTRLKISDQSDFLTLSNYWSAGGRNKEILPLLKSVAETEGAETLDIVHLLPPTPRKLLHTYPLPDREGIGNELPDCFWSAFSFFGDAPSSRHLDTTIHVFDERYLQIPPPYQLGDLILIYDKENDQILHACNYLADDLVFTKNGQSLGRASHPQTQRMPLPIRRTRQTNRFTSANPDPGGNWSIFTLFWKLPPGLWSRSILHLKKSSGVFPTKTFPSCSNS